MAHDQPTTDYRRKRIHVTLSRGALEALDILKIGERRSRSGMIEELIQRTAKPGMILDEAKLREFHEAAMEPKPRSEPDPPASGPKVKKMRDGDGMGGG